MTTQTNLDLTDKQPTALMRLEAVLKDLIIPSENNSTKQWNVAIVRALQEIEIQKPSELADLKQAFGDGYTETESAETWAKKWKQTEQ